jgi:hypothetical protein
MSGAMNYLGRRRIAVQTWFIASAGLVLLSILGLQHSHGAIAPAPAVPSLGWLVASIALALGIAGLLALLLRSRSSVIYRCAGSIAGSMVFAFVVLCYGFWVYREMLEGIPSPGGP